MSRSDLVSTRVGTLHTEIIGSGPPVLLWHSMLVDGTQWQRVVSELSGERTLIVVDGPGHGRSGRPAPGYTLDDCADAAAELLSSLGFDAVDWVGNAWGGHVGLVFASRHPDRCRSVVAIATPTVPLSASERMETRLLAGVYRLVGPRKVLSDAIADTLLSKESRRTDPQARKILADGFARADRTGMHRSMHAMMLHRPDIGALLPGITAPALFLAGSDDRMWPPQTAGRYAERIPGGRTGTVQGAHRLPPLECPAVVSAQLREFWAHVAELQTRP